MGVHGADPGASSGVIGSPYGSLFERMSSCLFCLRPHLEQCPSGSRGWGEVYSLGAKPRAKCFTRVLSFVFQNNLLDASRQGPYPKMLGASKMCLKMKPFHPDLSQEKMGVETMQPITPPCGSAVAPLDPTHLYFPIWWDK